MNSWEKHTTKNRREQVVADRYEALGYTVFHKGWPDFLIERNGEIELVEVKPTMKRTCRAGRLSRPQQRLKAILEKHFKYTVEYVD